MSSDPMVNLIFFFVAISIPSFALIGCFILYILNRIEDKIDAIQADVETTKNYAKLTAQEVMGGNETHE